MYKFLRAPIYLFLILISLQANAQTDTARIVSEKVHIPQLNRERTIQVFLPAGYASSHKKYPVIYMHDAQNIYSNSKNPYGSWYVDSLIKTMPAAKQAIVVGIDNGKNRIMEYNAWDSQYGKAEGAEYAEFIVKTLKPHIDSVYRTKPQPKYTAIAGSSMGGLISMYAAVMYPEVFGTAGVFSPSFWIAPKMYTMVEEQKPNTKNRFFLACGDKEGNEVDYVTRMDSTLHARGFSIKNVPAPLVIKNAKHNEQQWRVAFVEFYRWWVSSF